MATNLILAFAGAAGVFAAVLALGLRPRARLEDIGGLIEPRPGPLERLQQMLTEADLEVTAGEPRCLCFRGHRLLQCSSAVASTRIPGPEEVAVKQGSPTPKLHHNYRRRPHRVVPEHRRQGRQWLALP